MRADTGTHGTNQISIDCAVAELRLQIRDERTRIEIDMKNTYKTIGFVSTTLLLGISLIHSRNIVIAQVDPASGAAVAGVVVSTIGGLASWVEKQGDDCSAAAYGSASGDECPSVPVGQQRVGWTLASANALEQNDCAFGFGSAVAFEHPHGSWVDWGITPQVYAGKLPLHNEENDSHHGRGWAKGKVDGNIDLKGGVGLDPSADIGDVVVEVRIESLSVEAPAFSSSAMSSFEFQVTVDDIRIFYSSGRVDQNGFFEVEGDIGIGLFTQSYDETKQLWIVSLEDYIFPVTVDHLEVDEEKTIFVDFSGEMESEDHLSGSSGLFGGGGTGGRTIWGIDNGTDTIGTFDIGSPGVFNPIGTTGIVSGFVNSIEFDGLGNLWASDGVSLYSVDTGTGAGTLVGHHKLSEGTMSDFAWDGHQMFGISTTCGSESKIQTISLASGQATEFCSSLIPSACDVGLTIDDQGRMYGHDLVSDQIYLVNRDCDILPVVSLPFDSNFGQALTSGSNGLNYHVAFNSTAFVGELYEFDAAGNYNFLGTLAPLQIAGADTEPGTSDCLSMSVTTLVAGLSGTWDVSGATPGESVAIVYGFQPGTTKVSGTSGFCATFDIKGVKASQLICRKNADGAGNVSCRVPIPSGAAGVRVLSQAAERNTCPDQCVSNVDDQTIS